jgi:hypothetical protein
MPITLKSKIQHTKGIDYLNIFLNEKKHKEFCKSVFKKDSGVSIGYPSSKNFSWFTGLITGHYQSTSKYGEIKLQANYSKINNLWLPNREGTLYIRIKNITAPSAELQIEQWFPDGTKSRCSESIKKFWTDYFYLSLGLAKPVTTLN